MSRSFSGKAISVLLTVALLLGTVVTAITTQAAIEVWDGTVA